MAECGENVDIEPLQLEARLVEESDDVPYLEVVETKGECFGPQPYLAIKTKSRDLSMTILTSIYEKWFYAFHSDTLPLSDVESIGVASSDKLGNISVVMLTP